MYAFHTHTEYLQAFSRYQAQRKPQFSSVQSLSRVRLCDPMDCSRPGFPVHHQLPEFIQTQVYWAHDAIQPPHPLSSPSPAFNLSQHQGLFQWVGSLHQVAKVLEFQLQHLSNEYLGWISFRMDWLDLFAGSLLPSLYTILTFLTLSCSLWSEPHCQDQLLSSKHILNVD